MESFHATLFQNPNLPTYRVHFQTSSFGNILYYKMSKRASDDCIPAAKRLKHDVDAMGCLILACNRDNARLSKEVKDVKEKNKYLTEQVERLDAYTFELENRMATMETLITSMIAGGNHNIVDAYIHGMREHNNYDMTDLDRILADWETEYEFSDVDLDEIVDEIIRNEETLA